MSLQAEREFNLARSRYQPLVVVFVAASLGVTADYLYAVPFASWLVVSVFGLLAWLVQRGRLWRPLATPLLLTAIAGVGGGVASRLLAIVRARTRLDSRPASKGRRFVSRPLP